MQVNAATRPIRCDSILHFGLCGSVFFKVKLKKYIYISYFDLAIKHFI